jgi:hypothetical protein
MRKLTVLSTVVALTLATATSGFAAETIKPLTAAKSTQQAGLGGLGAGATIAVVAGVLVLAVALTRSSTSTTTTSTTTN